MSRIVVYGKDNYNVGELNAVCNRGYTIHGSENILSGGGTTIILNSAAAQQPWLQFGRMVEVQHKDLPPWAGVIDAPWTATLPVEVTIYPVEHLLTLCTPDYVQTWNRSIDQIIHGYIDVLNSKEDFYFRMGRISCDQTFRYETMEQRPLWDQLTEFLQKTATKMVFRPGRWKDNRLYIFLDVGPVGEKTSLLLHDGAHANMQIVSASVDGEIYNSVTGISDQNTEESRLQTAPFEDSISRERYKLRSTIVQFENVTEMTTLEANTRAFLAASSYPKLLLTVKAFNRAGEFQYLAPGNTILVHAANLRLPGGIRGWRKEMYIEGMVYNESDESVLLNLTGVFNG